MNWKRFRKLHKIIRNGETILVNTFTGIITIVHNEVLQMFVWTTHDNGNTYNIFLSPVITIGLFRCLNGTIIYCYEPICFAGLCLLSRSLLGQFVIDKLVIENIEINIMLYLLRESADYIGRYKTPPKVSCTIKVLIAKAMLQTSII